MREPNHGSLGKKEENVKAGSPWGYANQDLPQADMERFPRLGYHAPEIRHENTV